MKIKIFKNSSSFDTSSIENKINEWLKNDIEVKQTLLTVVKDEFLVYTFLYYDKKDLRKEKLDEINNKQ